MSALASSTYPVRSQQARAILIRPGDNADRFVSPTPSDPHKMGWGCTAIRGRKPTPRIGPSYSRCNPGRYFLSGTRRACKKGKPGHMSESGRPLLLKRYPSSKSSKPKCALDLPRCRHNTNAPQAILIQVGIGSCARIPRSAGCRISSAEP